MGAPRAIALCRCFTGALEFQTGHWSEAENALRESIKLYREIGAASGEALSSQRLGVLQTARGQLEEGLATLNEGIQAAEHALMRAHCLTRLYAAMARNRLAAGDIVAAGSVLALGLEMSERHGHCTTCDALLLPAAVSVRVAQNDFRAAESFCNRLDLAADQYASTLWLAMARQSRGELAAAQGEVVSALEFYTAARNGFDAVGNEYEVARCLDALSNLYLRRTIPEDLAAGQAARQNYNQIMEKLSVS